MSKRRIGSLVATMLFFTVITVAALNVQRIQDLALFYQYEPNSTVASFASDTGMSERGKFLFYVSQPSLLDAERFGQQCERKEGASAILGCYDGQRIYIYDISNPQLAGIRPTTAAHEMLHAAYRRLSTKDKQAVDALLDTEYEKLQGNEELVDRMAMYARTQPGERENELHSIIGTEVASIGPELEQYYGRYFADRSKVIAQHEQYRTVFEELRARSDELTERMSAIDDDIKNQIATYNLESSQVQAAIASFNTRAENGEIESQSVFTRERQALLASMSALEVKRTRIVDTIAEFDALAAEQDSIALEINTLNQSLDSQLAPVPSL